MVRAGRALHRHSPGSACRDAGPAIGDERVSDEAGPHNRIRHVQAAADDLRLGDLAIVATYRVRALGASEPPSNMRPVRVAADAWVATDGTAGPSYC